MSTTGISKHDRPAGVRAKCDRITPVKGMDLCSKFGMWTVIGPDEANRKRVICRCDCGTTRAVYSYHLKRGKSRSCGCFTRDMVARRGCSRDHKKTAEYTAWRSMWCRVRGLKGPESYRSYVERGIRVCGRWKKFSNFLADMGPRPSPKHSIDRVDNDGNYEPGNCRWATASQQMLNTRTSRRNTSGIRGVYRNKRDGKWRAKFRGNHLGLFVDKDEARSARCAAMGKWEKDRDVLPRGGL